MLITQDLLAVQVPFRLDTRLLRLFTIIEVSLSINRMPLRKEIVLNPNHLSNRLHNSNLPRQCQPWVREDGFGHGILDVSQAGSEKDVIDV